jgi:hypothetical protein
MSVPGRRAFHVLLLVAVSTGHGLAKDPSISLGLCPPAAGRLDSYIQALCDGETALQAGNSAKALARFRFAATLPRIDATNELAWAGLAAAHCRARDFDQARPWSAHFAQARQLWLGELDCDASGRDPRAGLSPFVRSRMCSEPLAADYALLRQNPDEPYALEVKARLQRVAEALTRVCSTPATTAKAGVAEAGKQVSSRGTRKVKKKRTRRAAVQSHGGKTRAK